MGIDSLLTQTVTIYPTTGTTVSASGEVTRNYSTTGVPARADIQKARVMMRRIDLGEQVYGEYTGFFLPQTSIHELDKVVDQNSVEYLVLYVDPIRGHHLEVSLHRGIF